MHKKENLGRLRGAANASKAVGMMQKTTTSSTATPGRPATGADAPRASVNIGDPNALKKDAASS